MSLARNLLITVLVFYCCFMIFKLSINSGLFFLPLLFVASPLILRGKKAFGFGE